MDPRTRYPPPGIGNGRSGNVSGNPNYYGRNPNQPQQPQQQQQQQQYVQRSPMQGQQYQQTWMRRNAPMGSDAGPSEQPPGVKSAQPSGTDTIDSRYK